MKQTPPLDNALAADAEALREQTESNLWDSKTLARALRNGHRQSKEHPMLDTIKRRPRLFTAATLAAVTVALLFIPVSYERTVGHELTVELPATEFEQARTTVRELARSLSAQSVRVEHRGDLFAATYSLRSSEERANRLAGTIRDALASRGFTPTVQIAPITETVSGNVYAMTLDKWFSIYVETDGKTDDEVADEILEQLESHGVDDAEAEFERTDDGSRMRIAGEKDGHRFEMVRKSAGGEDDGVLAVEPIDIDTEREPGMTDEELEEKILTQLEELGLDGEVEVNGEEVRVQVTKKLKCTGAEDDPEGCPEP